MSDAEFERIWNESTSPTNVAHKLKRGLSTVKARATHLRKTGRKLKKFKPIPGVHGPMFDPSPEELRARMAETRVGYVCPELVEQYGKWYPIERS